LSYGLNIIIKIIGIFFAGILMIYLGKYDQKRKLPLWLKLFFQTLIAFIVIAVGVRIDFLRNYSGSYWYLNNLSIPITIIWLLAITNSIGQTDDLGEITPTIIFIASLTFFVVSLFQRQGLIMAEILSVFLIICFLDLFWPLSLL